MVINVPKTIEVVYEHGVFRPLEKVDLPDKAKLRIGIDDIEDLLKEFCGLLESKISLEDVEKLRYEVKIWKKP